MDAPKPQRTEKPPKPKLFLNSNDVSDLTRYSLRNSRMIMRHVRAELNLSSHQSISIYAFSKVFSIPADILYWYINMTDFENLPITREDLSGLEMSDLKALSQHINYLKSNEFIGIIHQPRIPKADAQGSDQD